MVCEKNKQRETESHPESRMTEQLEWSGHGLRWRRPGWGAGEGQEGWERGDSEWGCRVKTLVRHLNMSLDFGGEAQARNTKLQDTKIELLLKAVTVYEAPPRMER